MKYSNCNFQATLRWVFFFVCFHLQERDFDLHADYIKNEPVAQEILMKNDEIRDYFEVCQLKDF